MRCYHDDNMLIIYYKGKTHCFWGHAPLDWTREQFERDEAHVVNWQGVPSLDPDGIIKGNLKQVKLTEVFANV